LAIRKARGKPPVTTKPILFGHHESGHSYKVRLALVLLGIDHEYRYVDVMKPLEHRRKDFRAVTPYGEIPVLVTGDEALAQSDAILLHLARTTGRFGGDDLDLTAQWLFREANRIGFSLPNLRWEWHFMGAADEGLLGWLRRRAEADLADLEDLLSEQPFLTGEQLSVADIAHAGYMWFADQAKVDIAAYPNISAWLKRIEALPGWEHPYALMAKEREGAAG
jgi:glutathione S-transferase